MKLYKALKLRKNLIGDITKLKIQIKEKNSYLAGSLNGEKFSAEEVYKDLLDAIEELTAIKFVINEANREIQAKIYLLGEYKALIAFWNEVSVAEGSQVIGYSDKIQTYMVHYDESKRNEMVNAFQKKVDAIQDELDEFNFNTEIPWGNMTDDELATLSSESNKDDKCNEDSENSEGHDDTK